MIRVIVVNRHHNPAGPNVVNVQRGTIWGNETKIGTGVDRQMAIDRYVIGFERRIQTDPGFRRQTLALLDHAVDGWLMLECSCAPRRCHADVIAKWLNEQVAKQ